MPLKLSDPGPGLINITKDFFCWRCAYVNSEFESVARRVLIVALGLSPPGECLMFCEACFQSTKVECICVVRVEEWVENNRRRQWWDEMQGRIRDAAERTARLLAAM